MIPARTSCHSLLLLRAFFALRRAESSLMRVSDYTGPPLFGCGTLRRDAGFCASVRLRLPKVPHPSPGTQQLRPLRAAHDVSVLDRKTLATVSPVWVGWSPSFDSQDPSEPHRTQFDNLAGPSGGLHQPRRDNAHPTVARTTRPARRGRYGVDSVRSHLRSGYAYRRRQDAAGRSLVLQSMDGSRAVCGAGRDRR